MRPCCLSRPFCCRLICSLELPSVSGVLAVWLATSTLVTYVFGDISDVAGVCADADAPVVKGVPQKNLNIITVVDHLGQQIKKIRYAKGDEPRTKRNKIQFFYHLPFIEI